jgi:WD40 repeat protein
VLLSEESNKIKVLSHREITPIAEFSRDGKLVATGSWDGKARVWEVVSGSLLTEVQASPEQVDQIEFSSDGALLLTVGFSMKNMIETQVAHVWDTKTGSLVAELKGHTAAIASARFDPTGKRIVTGSWDKTVRLWEANSGKLLKTLIGHHDVVAAVAFSPDGELVLSGSNDLTVRCWNATTGTIKAISGQPAISKLLAETIRRFVSLSSSTKRALTYDGKRATVYDPQTGKELRDLADFPSSCHKVVFSNDDRMIACPSGDGAAFVWDVETGKRVSVFRGHKGELNEAAFSPNNRTLLTSGTDNTARGWAIEETGRDLTLGVHDAAVTSALWSPNGQLVATGSADGTARVWDAQTGALVSALSSPGRVKSISFSGDNRRLLVARYDGGGAHVWDARTGTVVMKLNIGQTEPTFEDPGNWSPEGSIIILAVAEKLPAKFIKPGEIPDLKQLPDLKELLPPLQGNLLRWDGKSGQTLPAINAGKGPGHSRKLMCGYSRAAGLACLKTDNETLSLIWDVKTGSMISELRGHLNPMMLGTMSADGRLVAMSDQEQVEIWETRPGRLRSKIAAKEKFFVTGVEFDLSGTMLVTGGGQREPVGYVWESASGRLLRELRGHSHSINSARFSPDGRLIVTASQDNTARVWTVADGRTIATLRGHRDMIFDARFSPDGGKVLTASNDGTARIYDISLAKPLGELIELARERQTRELTPEETRQYRP